MSSILSALLAFFGSAAAALLEVAAVFLSTVLFSRGVSTLADAFDLFIANLAGGKFQTLMVA
jgi:hypothetical protein